MKKILITFFLVLTIQFLYAQRGAYKYTNLIYDRLPLVPLPSSVQTYSTIITGTTSLSRGNYTDQYLHIKQLRKVERTEAPNLVVEVKLRGGFTPISEEVKYRVETDKNQNKVAMFYFSFNYVFPISYSVYLDDGYVLESNELIPAAEIFQYKGPEALNSDLALMQFNEIKEEELRRLETEKLTEAMTKLGTHLDKTYSASNITESIALGRAEGNEKKYNYSDIDQGYNHLLTGLGLYNGKDFTGAKMELEPAIRIFEKALEELDLVNPKARINEKVGSMLHYNLGLIYFLLDDFNQAEKHTSISMTYSKGTGDSFSVWLKSKIDDRKLRYKANGK